MSGTYDVVLLVEQALTVVDARQVLSLHEELDDPVVYHVLLPYEDAAARIEASMGGGSRRRGAAPGHLARRISTVAAECAGANA